jgi:hypothetical protein
MTTASAPHPAMVALPAGAVSTEERQPNDGGRYYRNFEAEIREVVAGTRYGAHVVAVYAHGIQHDDATIDNGTTDRVFAAPAISIDTIDVEGGFPTETGITLTREAARRLADVLVAAADEIDGWSAR